MKMTEFRSRHPISDDELATIRTNVIATIRARHARRWMPIAMRFAAAAAIIVAIGIAFVAGRQGRGTRDEGSTTAAHVAPVVVAPAAPVANSPSVVETAHVAISPNASIPTTNATTRAVYRHKHRPLPHSDYQTIRMEIRTADPDVRIIWIASQKPATASTTGGNS
ncbi:MAG: hypothetical protein QOK37_3980 [Thermoanaerobaculia bacterium]|jgi:hypothetical protein|nr:hypothetical protein [Thermoanaerobaculia bacterium]